MSEMLSEMSEERYETMIIFGDEFIHICPRRHVHSYDPDSYGYDGDD